MSSTDEKIIAAEEIEKTVDEAVETAQAVEAVETTEAAEVTENIEATQAVGALEAAEADATVAAEAAAAAAVAAAPEKAEAEKSSKRTSAKAQRRAAINDNLTPNGRRMLIISRVLVYIVLIFLSVLCLFSFYMLIINSTRSNGQLQSGFTLIPNNRFLDNFNNAWNDFSVNIPRGMINSMILAASNAILTTYFSALTAYGIHAYDFKLKKFAFMFIMAVMMIPSQVSAVGFYRVCLDLKLTNNYLPLILPSAAAPVVFFYMKQYMESVLPLEIVEAARVDGSNELHTFNRIVLPIMMPAVAVQMIFSFVASWNNFFIPALILDKKELKTVPLMIAALRSADYSKFDMGKVYMFMLLAILPVIVVYLLLSKFIIKGAAEGSVKG